MKNNIFTYWDYDSLQGKPRRELTALGATLFVIFGAIIACGVMYGILVLFAVL
jgi:hypothetical protein